MATIYDTIGGRDSVTAAVELFCTRVLADPTLRPYFADTDMRAQKAHMRAFLASALGGPDVYRGRDMHAAHAHLRVTDEAFDRVVDHLVWTLDALGLPDDVIEAIGAKLAPLRADIVAEPLERAA
jgi:hemoglobin